ncbi:UNVERIFIED_CONTAM: hypothetical protein GTU68_051792 [Idotea baltica]|nr:hypothetical protein [Idotea baltica]
MDFHYMSPSPPCRSVMLTAKALGLTLNKIEVNVFEGQHMTPEFIEMNPQHSVPTLVDGDLTLWESRPICTYLVAKYGEDDSLYPADPEQRFRIDRLLYFDMGTLYTRFLKYAGPALFQGEDPDPAKLESLNEALGWFNGFLEGHEFCVGDSITVADFSLIASISSLIEAGIDMSEFANITPWVERCQEQMVDYESENGEGAKAFGEFAKPKLCP